MTLKLLTFIMLASIFSCSDQKNSTSKSVNSEDKIEPKKTSDYHGDLDHSDTIAFKLSAQSNIIFKAVLNDLDTLNLFFDTGSTGLLLTHESIKKNTTLLANNKDYTGEDFVPLKSQDKLNLGPISWDSLEIYPISMQPKETDGHFGWDLFEDKIVELDYDNNWMIIHSQLPKKTRTYQALDLEFTHTLFCVVGDITVNDKNFKNRYLFDSGFQRAIVMDADLRKENNFPKDLPAIKTSKLKNSSGEEFVNKVVQIDRFCFEDICISKIPVQLFEAPNPAQFKTHILGNELLKRFNTVFDFHNQKAYIITNSLINEPYKDAS